MNQAREAPPSSGRTVEAAATAAFAALLLSPLLFSPRWDSFPVSSYPMFARGDLGRVATLAHAVLVHADGNRTPASPADIGSPEPMIAAAVIRGHVERGTALELCQAVATRVLDRADVVAVEVVTSVFDSRRYFSGTREARTPLSRQVHARCERPR